MENEVSYCNFFSQFFNTEMNFLNSKFLCTMVDVVVLWSNCRYRICVFPDYRDKKWVFSGPATKIRQRVCDRRDQNNFNRDQGGSRIFSRGGGFSKNFQNFCILIDLFFRSTKLIFRALPKHGLVPVLAPQAKFWKSCPEKAFLGTFWKILTKNRVFSVRDPPSKLVYIGAEGAFKKIKGRPAKNWFLKKYQREDPLGRQWVESLRGGRPPLNPPLTATRVCDLCFGQKMVCFDRLHPGAICVILETINVLTELEGGKTFLTESNRAVFSRNKFRTRRNNSAMFDF